MPTFFAPLSRWPSYSPTCFFSSFTTKTKEDIVFSSYLKFLSVNYSHYLYFLIPTLFIYQLELASVPTTTLKLLLLNNFLSTKCKVHTFILLLLNLLSLIFSVDSSLPIEKEQWNQAIIFLSSTIYFKLLYY